MAEAHSAVALRGAVVRYASRPAPIGPVDIDIAQGEIVALVGASGSGKSSLLRLMAGLERAAEGEVTRTVPQARIGLVFQSPTLMPWASTLDNVRLPLDLMGVPRAEALERARDALAAVGLADRTEATPAQLSGGMAMRVALARALVARPRLLLMDEPFAALDSVTRRGLIQDLHRVWDQSRPAVVFVTHDVAEAAYLAGRALVLDQASGQVARIVDLPGALPRPPGWRQTQAARTAEAALTEALAEAMKGSVEGTS